MSLTLLPECHTLKKRLLTSTFVPAVARGARLVLTPSDSTRRDVVRLLGIDPARVRAIPYAPPPEFGPVSAGPEGLAAAYGNIGFMGPGLALLAFGEPAAVPVALVFCFENMLHFMVAPALMSEGKKLQTEQAVGMGSNGRAAVSAGVGVADD